MEVAISDMEYAQTLTNVVRGTDFAAPPPNIAPNLLVVPPEMLDRMLPHPLVRLVHVAAETLGMEYVLIAMNVARSLDFVEQPQNIARSP